MLHSTLQITRSGRPFLPTSIPASPRTHADQKLIALGRKFAPLFARWRTQVAAAQAGMTITAREKLYRQNDRLHREAGELIDAIMAQRPSTAAGLKVQVEAALVDACPDALFLSPDPRQRGFFAGLCAFAGVELPGGMLTTQ